MSSVLGLLALGLGVPLAGASSAEYEDSAGLNGCRGDVVVQFDTRLWARPGHDAFVVDLAQPLGPGTWLVNAESFDDYEGREDIEQSHEQWMLELRVGTNVVATLGPTTDIPDGSDSGYSKDQLGAVTFSQQVDNIRLVHFLDLGDDDIGSVTASCVGFELLSPPATTTTTPPSTATTTTTTTTAEPVSSTTTTRRPSSTTTTEPASSPNTTRRPATTTSLKPPEPPPTSGSPTTTSLPDTTPVSDPVQGDDGADGSEVALVGPPTGAAQRPLGAITRLRAAVDCSSQIVSATVSNLGDQTTSVDVFLVTEAARTGIQLQAGASTQVDFVLPVASEGQVLDLVVADDSGVADTGQVLVDCQSPAAIVASVVVDCPSDSLNVVIINTGQETSSIDVLVERSGLVATLELKGAESRTVSVVVGGRSEIPLRIVDAEGNDVLRKVVTVDCPRPQIESSSTVSCISGEVLISVWNSGDAAGLVGVSTDAETVRDVKVRPGTVVVIGLPFDQGSSVVPVRLVALGGAQISTTDVSTGCGQTPPDTSVPCASVSVVVGSQASTSIVSTPAPGEPWWVDAGPLPAGLVGVPEIGASRSCAVPSAVFSVDCSAGTLGVRLSNAGSIATRIAVLVDGQAQGSGFDVGPGSSSEVSFVISDSNQVTLIEAGRVEPLTSFDLGCGSGGGVAKTVSYAVFSVTVLGTLLAMVFDPRKWLLFFR